MCWPPVWIEAGIKVEARRHERVAGGSAAAATASRWGRLQPCMLVKRARSAGCAEPEPLPCPPGSAPNVPRGLLLTSLTLRSNRSQSLPSILSSPSISPPLAPLPQLSTLLLLLLLPKPAAPLPLALEPGLSTSTSTSPRLMRKMRSAESPAVTKYSLRAEGQEGVGACARVCARWGSEVQYINASTTLWLMRQRANDGHQS